MEAELEQLNAIYQTITEFFINYSFQLVGALIIIMLGFWLGNRLAALILRLCERSQLDITLSKFLASVAKILFVTVMAIIALGKIGISIGPFVAALICDTQSEINYVIDNPDSRPKSYFLVNRSIIEMYLYHLSCTN